MHAQPDAAEADQCADDQRGRDNQAVASRREQRQEGQRQREIDCRSAESVSAGEAEAARVNQMIDHAGPVAAEQALHLAVDQSDREHRQQQKQRAAALSQQQQRNAANDHKGNAQRASAEPGYRGEQAIQRRWRAAQADQDRLVQLLGPALCNRHRYRGKTKPAQSGNTGGPVRGRAGEWGKFGHSARVFCMPRAARQPACVWQVFLPIHRRWTISPIR